MRWYWCKLLVTCPLPKSLQISNLLMDLSTHAFFTDGIEEIPGFTLGNLTQIMKVCFPARNWSNPIGFSEVAAATKLSGPKEVRFDGIWTRIDQISIKMNDARVFKTGWQSWGFIRIHQFFLLHDTCFWQVVEAGEKERSETVHVSEHVWEAPWSGGAQALIVTTEGAQTFW